MFINGKKYETIEWIKPNAKATVLFIHGFTGNYYHHYFIANYLPKDINFIALNFPACGQTPPHIHPYNSRQNYAKLIANYVRKLNLKNIIVVAHSMGASVTAFLSQLIPNRIIGYFLESPENISLLQRQEVIIDSEKDSLRLQIQKIQKFASNPYKIKDLIQTNKAILKAKYLATHPFALKVFYDLAIKKNLLNSITKTNSLFQQFNKPTTIMFGKLDTILYYTPSYQNFSDLQNPSIKLITVSNAGHSIYKDAKLTYLKTLLNYLLENHFSNDEISIQAYLKHLNQYSDPSNNSL